MVIKRSAAHEVARLINALLSAHAGDREAAAARLAIVGSRAVERLAATLPGLRDASQVTAVLDAIERIGDHRGPAIATPWLQDPRDDVALAALAVLRRGLQADDPEVAARALDSIATTALARPALRAAAGQALDDLPDEVVAPLRARISGATAATTASDGDGASHSRQLTAWLDGTSQSSEQVRTLLAGLDSDTPLSVLHRIIGRLRETETSAQDDQRAAWRTMRGQVHEMLAARDSTVALYDLREALADPPEELPVSMLAALARLADATCLEPLADAWSRTGHPWVKGQLEQVFRTAVERSGMTARHAAWRRVATRHPDLTNRISTPSRTRPSRSPGGRP